MRKILTIIVLVAVLVLTLAIPLMTTSLQSHEAPQLAIVSDGPGVQPNGAMDPPIAPMPPTEG